MVEVASFCNSTKIFLINLQQDGLELNFKDVPEFLILCKYKESPPPPNVHV
jgi:hypothetical protein